MATPKEAHVVRERKGISLLERERETLSHHSHTRTGLEELGEAGWLALLGCGEHRSGEQGRKKANKREGRGRPKRGCSSGGARGGRI